ncbi:MAG: hypothetical protein A3H31_07585 [Gallionellales bacterium RIFCSPLOWO2_02_FULL_57_47]|nr:MAG: hypothetical protein A3H31_07585 [Gallionellales bacterium RIFCSPLOWO2_02_FULL_57_47]
MENINENNTGQESNSAEIPGTSPGKMLREARELLGLSVMDVASQIKFAPRQIEALEADDYQRLPEAAFLRGFVRSYAKILHLDAETVLTALPQNKAVPAELIPGSVGEPFPDVNSVLRQNLNWLIAALLLAIIVAGLALWQFTAPPEQSPGQPRDTLVESPVSLPEEIQIKPEEPVPEAAVIEPEAPKTRPSTETEAPKRRHSIETDAPRTRPSAAAAQSSVEAAGTEASRVARQNQATASDTEPDASAPVISLRLEFSEESWAEIKDREGKILSSRIHAGGSEMRLSGRAPLSILIGNAPSVRLYFRDKEIDLAPYTRTSTQVAHLMLE